MTGRVLIVDDEANMRWVLKEALSMAGFEVSSAASGQEALTEMAQHPADLVILDLKMKGMDGLATLRLLQERWPEVAVIILTAYGTVATAVEAMQLGAADYLRKPFDVEEVSFKIQRALERKALQAELRYLRQVARSPTSTRLAGTHPIWQRCVDQVRSLTVLDLNLVIWGEVGVGKRVLAQLSHGLSSRREAPLVEVDLHTLAPDLQQQVLVGHRSGEGAWSRAGAGTLLLRNADALVQEGWIALADLVAQKTGRSPRLLLTARAALPPFANMPFAEVRVPPLREHLDDLPLLARAFIPEITLMPATLHLLQSLTWPGNVAELRGVIELAAALAEGSLIEERHLPEWVRHAPVPGVPIRLPPEGLSLEAVETTLLRQALDLAGGNKTHAAELLGLTRHTLLYRLEKYGLE